MTGESLGLQWATQSYDEAVTEAGNRINLADPVTARQLIRDALRICRETLGVKWLKLQADEARRGGFLMLDGPDDTFAGPEDATEAISRLFDLAVELHEARKVGGFEHLLDELRSRSIYEALAELRAVNHMLRAGEAARFVDPSSMHGPSFDAVVVLGGIEVACEVKVKLPKPVEAFRAGLIVNSLSKARKQLPPSGPSLIYLQLASPWTDDPPTMASIDNTILKWLDSTGRVNGVLVMAERRFHQVGLSASRLRGSYYLANPRPHCVVDGL